MKLSNIYSSHYHKAEEMADRWKYLKSNQKGRDEFAKKYPVEKVDKAMREFIEQEKENVMRHMEAQGLKLRDIKNPKMDRTGFILEVVDADYDEIEQAFKKAKYNIKKSKGYNGKIYRFTAKRPNEHGVSVWQDDYKHHLKHTAWIIQMDDPLLTSLDEYVQKGIEANKRAYVPKKKIPWKYATARKYMGDDSHSWAVFLKGSHTPYVSGLTAYEVSYYKLQLENKMRERNHEELLKLSDYQ